jgi:XisI protein
MGDHDDWRAVIERVFTEQVRVPVSHGEIALSTVFDRPGDHYLVMAVGWDGTQRVHAPLLHVDILGDKLWIQHDGTETGIASEFVAAGIPRSSIVLAFKHPSRRRFSEYAAA